MSSTGLVAYVDLDERAIDALREFNEEGALTVLQQFKESDLSHVQVSESAKVTLVAALRRSPLACCERFFFPFFMSDTE